MLKETFWVVLKPNFELLITNGKGNLNFTFYYFLFKEKLIRGFEEEGVLHEELLYNGLLLKPVVNIKILSFICLSPSPSCFSHL